MQPNCILERIANPLMNPKLCWSIAIYLETVYPPGSIDNLHEEDRLDGFGITTVSMRCVLRISVIDLRSALEFAGITMIYTSILRYSWNDSLSQSPCDRILWILANNGVKRSGADWENERNEICAANAYPEELERDSRIKGAILLPMTGHQLKGIADSSLNEIIVTPGNTLSCNIGVVWSSRPANTSCIGVSCPNNVWFSPSRNASCVGVPVHNSGWLRPVSNAPWVGVPDVWIICERDPGIKNITKIHTAISINFNTSPISF